MSKPAHARPGLTARFGPPVHERDLPARDEEDAVRIFVDPDLGGADHGYVVREDSEDEERHARRAAALDRLFGTGR